MKNDKYGFSMSFNWIFAIIAGVFIIFFAIYFASKFISTGEKQIGTETAAKLVSLFEPTETGLSSGKKPEEIIFSKNMEVDFTCNENTNKPFGRQGLSYAEIGLNNKIGEKSSEISIKNKYVFTKKKISGNKIILFSKPLSIGFKTADIIVVSGENYCFFKADENFKEELKDISNIKFEDRNINNCTGIKVCFADKTGCDILITKNCADDCTYDFGTVSNKKEGYSIGYIGNLVYGAVFSDKDIYECNVKRIMNRFNELGKVYLDKIDIIRKKGCDSEVDVYLDSLMKKAMGIESSKELGDLIDPINSLDNANEESGEGCRVY